MLKNLENPLKPSSSFRHLPLSQSTISPLNNTSESSIMVYNHSSWAISPKAEQSQPITPLLAYLTRIPTPILVIPLRRQERAEQAVIHAAMVARSTVIFEVPISEAICTFTLRPLNMRGTIIRQERWGPAKIPSLDPLPVPLRVTTPFLQDILHPFASSMPTFPPLYSSLNSLQYVPHTPSSEIKELGEAPNYNNGMHSHYGSPDPP
jgi:hypothetical protein